MNKHIGSQHISGDKQALLSNVALLYYGEGLTQNEIAKRMKVSRATIVNILRESREHGIVDIRVNGRHLTESTVSRNLRERFSLEDVYVSQPEAGETLDRADRLRHLGRVAALAMLDMVEPGNRVGVAWGETILAVAESMPRNPVPDVQICQLIGSMISDRVPASENCAIQIASRLGAQSFTLHAPAMLSDAELANRLRTEPTIKSQLDRLSGLDLVVYSIGNMDPDTHFAAAGMAQPEDLDAARTAGVVGILCCRYLNSDGQEVALPLQDRLIAAKMSDLRQAKTKLLVVGGTDRKEATLAAIKGGLVTHLVVDQALAAALCHG